METSFWTVIGYATLAAAALAGGGAVAAYWPPSARVRSSVHHTAAGLVFAAVGVEVLPDVMHRDLPVPAALGFAVGVALMLTIEAVSKKIQEGSGGGSDWALVGVVAADIFVDGLLISVSAVTSVGQGQEALLVTIALTVELLALGLSIAASFGQNGSSRKRTILATSGVSLFPLLGATAGYFLAGALTPNWIEGVLAFAAAALLYLATEELLKEAHEVSETPWSTALLFAAFLALLLVDMIA